MIYFIGFMIILTIVGSNSSAKTSVRNGTIDKKGRYRRATVKADPGAVPVWKSKKPRALKPRSSSLN